MISVRGYNMKLVISLEHWAHNVCTLEQTPVGEQSHTCTEHIFMAVIKNVDCFIVIKSLTIFSE